MSSLTIYNHKGGVGKTTLTVNVAASLAKRGFRILIVDSDPQCNVTSHLLREEAVDHLLQDSDSGTGNTLWTALREIYNGTGPLRSIRPFKSTIANVLLLPGDIRLSEWEEYLYDAWTDCLKRRMGAIRATCALSDLVEATARRYKCDFVFYDTGPNIGPLNRIIALSCNHFVVPVACDLFSVRALTTLGQSLKKWIIDWQTIAAIAPPDALLSIEGRPVYLGHIPHKFKVYGQSMAQAPSHYMRRLDRKLYSDIIAVLTDIDDELVHADARRKLGEVQDFGSLAQKAQREGVALGAVQNYPKKSQKLKALQAFDAIADAIIERSKV